MHLVGTVSIIHREAIIVNSEYLNHENISEKLVKSLTSARVSASFRFKELAKALSDTILVLEWMPLVRLVIEDDSVES